MNRRAKVLNNRVLAGMLEENESGYVFTYDPGYLSDPESRSISLTLPRAETTHISSRLFPFFHGLLAEGALKEIQCRTLKIDENDHFGRLLKTAGGDVIGSVTIEEVM